MDSRRHHVDIAGRQLPVGSCVIHFYYSPAERRRFTSFLLEGLVAGEAVVLACNSTGYEVFREDLERLGVRGRGFTTIDIGLDYHDATPGISDALRQELRSRAAGRVLVDFGNAVPQTEIFELEAELNGALRHLPVVVLTQYDGAHFAAPVTIEQFRSHALAFVGNILVHENANYTPPAQYLQLRAAGSR